VDIATIQADGQQQIRPRQLVSLGLAALNEDRLFWTELSFERSAVACACSRTAVARSGRPSGSVSASKLALWPYEINPENLLSR